MKFLDLTTEISQETENTASTNRKYMTRLCSGGYALKTFAACLVVLNVKIAIFQSINRNLDFINNFQTSEIKF